MNSGLRNTMFPLNLGSWVKVPGRKLETRAAAGTRLGNPRWESPSLLGVGEARRFSPRSPWPPALSPSLGEGVYLAPGMWVGSHPNLTGHTPRDEGRGRGDTVSALLRPENGAPLPSSGPQGEPWTVEGSGAAQASIRNVPRSLGGRCGGVCSLRRWGPAWSTELCSQAPSTG